ncbi:MAG TPA: preprotein translocase subunit SecG [Candidatus Acidoferrales bacterium]|nr:preprotein translocase subunit SecG [Candidatus Acidoferrales bacterium]
MPSWAKWAASLAVAVALIAVGWRFVPILMTLHVLVCFILVIVIMLQSGSAADLAGAFGGAGSQTAFGPRGAATFLSRATTWCAIVFMMTSLTLSVKRAPTGSFSTGSILEETQPNAPAPKTAPAKPSTSAAPAQSSPVPAPKAPAQQQSAPAPAPSAPAQTPQKK